MNLTLFISPIISSNNLPLPTFSDMLLASINVRHIAVVVVKHGIITIVFPAFESNIVNTIIPSTLSIPNNSSR